MTMKLKAPKYRIRRPEGGSSDAPASPEPASEALPEDQADASQAAQSSDTPAVAAPAGGVDQQIDAIKREGLTGRQLRMARRVAHKHGLAPTSDFDAVRLLREKGINPFQRSNVLELVVPENKLDGPQVQKVQLPQTMPATSAGLPSTERVDPSVPAGPSAAEQRAGEIRKIQEDIAKRRRSRLIMLIARVAVFVFLPTLLAGWYFYTLATPMYATYAQLVVKANEPAGAGGGLLSGTGFASQQDSAGVQSYLTSRDAMTRLDGEFGFVAHFSQDHIDALQRLEPDASIEDAFGVYQDRVQVGYDPTEGIIRMEVIAADPETALQFSEALIRYAEERVDDQTARLREAAIDDALTSFQEAQARREAALDEIVRVQTELQSIDPAGEVASLTQQIATLETERTQRELELQSLLDVSRPNEARVNAARAAIDRLNTQIQTLRSRMTTATQTGASLTEIQSRLRRAEENYAVEVTLVTAAQESVALARVEARRQAVYLTRTEEPGLPDEATYPKAFENTLLTLLILSGIYLMISLTASILREQVSS